MNKENIINEVDKNIKNKLILIIGCLSLIMIILLSVFIYQTYAVYKVTDSHNFVNTSVKDKTLKINVYVDNVNKGVYPGYSYPSKTSYDYDKITCTNSGSGTFNTSTWTHSITQTKFGETVCNVYFKEKKIIVSYELKC